MDNFLKGFFGSSNSKEEKVQALLTEARSVGEQGDLEAVITSLNRAVKLNDRARRPISFAAAHTLPRVTENRQFPIIPTQ